jgi:hypothetical protein
VSLIFFFLDLLIWGQKSSGAIPIGTLLAIAFLWLCVSVPLVFVGSYFGFKKPSDDDPVRTNKIPRQIPEQPWYMHPVFSCLVGGVLPFGAVFIELFFILTSVWLHQFYYLFGFIALVFVILCVTCAEITIVLCYFQLCSEDYNWWWRAYFTSGSSALYLLVYSGFYFYTKLDITKFVPMLLYFGYMIMVGRRGTEGGDGGSRSRDGVCGRGARLAGGGWGLRAGAGLWGGPGAFRACGLWAQWGRNEPRRLRPRARFPDPRTANMRPPRPRQVSYGFFCLTGAIGWYACYVFNRLIYSAVKIE